VEAVLLVRAARGVVAEKSPTSSRRGGSTAGAVVADALLRALPDLEIFEAALLVSRVVVSVRLLPYFRNRRVNSGASANSPKA
jgi:hypothetical protein